MINGSARSGMIYLTWIIWMVSPMGCTTLSKNNDSDGDSVYPGTDSVETGTASTDLPDTNADTAADTETATAGESDTANIDTDTALTAVDTDFVSRARALVARMTIEEKASQMGDRAPAIPRLNIEEHDWWNEALHGVARAGIATVFPQAVSLAATFDDQLVFEVATVISTEARVKNNVQKKPLTYWSPTVNLARDPRWGRNEETYGEDPYLTSRMGVAFVRGMQGDDPIFLKTVSTPKHFIANNIEATRHTGSSDMDERNLREFYMPAFKATVVEGGAQSVMCAYNRVNGIPSCANSWLLTDVLRNEWGFGGYVVSDCWAIRDIVENHKYAETDIEASDVAIAAGTDLNCGDRYQADIVEAVALGVISEAEVDQALTRLFTARFMLGEFDAPQNVPYRAIPNSALDSPDNRMLAEKAAIKSMILLKNDGILPLEGTTVSSLAVIGPNANRLVFGGYSGTAAAPVTPLDGITAEAEKFGISVLFAEGAAIPGESETSSIEDATAIAASADAAIVVLGTDLSVADEEKDRDDITLSAIQEELLRAVQAVNANTILVLVTGMPLAINWADENLPAIINAGYGGQAAGKAIADVLFGNQNPGGRLPQTWFKSIEDLPAMDNYDIIQGKRTYMFFEGEVLYPFGYGLSYTQFEYSNLTLSPSTDVNGDIAISFDVMNTGEREGDEVAQVYIRDMDATVPVAIKKLQGFKRVSLVPSEVQTLAFTVHAKDLGFFDMSASQFVTEPGEMEVLIGASSADIRLKGTVTLTE
ncbi:MAG: glycoside hydrolase family 3 C-terminal domain-containing protein [Deltaproteobacteria bacterium]|nr:glycoside hydrolase family 3 C-terminal domain-containing protein [Deltaproteobacteria bacterium]